jgi:hypothetical protein
MHLINLFVKKHYGKTIDPFKVYLSDLWNGYL